MRRGGGFEGRRRSFRGFVISPIGTADSPQRAEADLVRDHVIRPALADLERLSGHAFVAPRGDERVVAGDYLQDLVSQIRDADFVIAVLFNHNPNVMYEIGIAHAAGHNVIILKSSQLDLPSDLPLHKVVEYRGEVVHTNNYRNYWKALSGPAARVRRTAVEPLTLAAAELSTMIKNAVSEERSDPPLGKHNALFGKSSIYNRFNEISMEEWSEIFLDAEEEIWLAGVSLWPLIRDRRAFKEVNDQGEFVSGDLVNLLTGALADGVDVNLVMMDENNPALAHLLTAEIESRDFGGHGALAKVKDEISESYAFWSSKGVEMAQVARERPSAERAPGRFRVVKVHAGLVQARVTLTEKRAVITPYRYVFSYNSGPCISANKGSLMHEETRRDLAFLRKHNIHGASDALTA